MSAKPDNGVTELQAGEVWCPFSRVRAGVSVGFNRDQAESAEMFMSPESFCVGSFCMAWRWRGWQYTKYHGTDRNGLLADEKYMSGKPEYDHLDHVGYCGLAGRP